MAENSESINKVFKVHLRWSLVPDYLVEYLLQIYGVDKVLSEVISQRLRKWDPFGEIDSKAMFVVEEGDVGVELSEIDYVWIGLDLWLSLLLSWSEVEYVVYNL